MTKEQTTNHKLLRYMEEINMWMNQDSMQYRLNRAKVHEFLRNNKIRIDGINERISKVHREFFKHEIKDGNPVFEMEGEGKDRKAVFAEGKNEEDHRKAIDAILQEETTVCW